MFNIDQVIVLFVCMFVYVCTCVGAKCVLSKLFSESDVACRKLGLGHMGVFNISKVSSRDVQRHKRVMGDAASSVNSAGG